MQQDQEICSGVFTRCDLFDRWSGPLRVVKGLIYTKNTRPVYTQKDIQLLEMAAEYLTNVYTRMRLLAQFILRNLTHVYIHHVPNVPRLETPYPAVDMRPPTSFTLR